MKVSKIIISGRAISQALWFMAIGPALGRLRKKNHDSKIIWVTQFQKETLPFFFLKCCMLFYFILESGSHTVVRAGLKLMEIHLPQSPKARIIGIGHHPWFNFI